MLSQMIVRAALNLRQSGKVKADSAQLSSCKLSALDLVFSTKTSAGTM